MARIHGHYQQLEILQFARSKQAYWNIIYTTELIFMAIYQNESKYDKI
jgi:hypothetical protein